VGHWTAETGASRAVRTEPHETAPRQASNRGPSSPLGPQIFTQTTQPLRNSTTGADPFFCCSLRIALCAPCSASTPKPSTPLIPTHRHRKDERRGKSTPPLPFATRPGRPQLAIPSGRRPARNAETAKMIPSPSRFMKSGDGLLARPQWCFDNNHCPLFCIDLVQFTASQVGCLFVSFAGPGKPATPRLSGTPGCC
jgi:hypothetical protein